MIESMYVFPDAVDEVETRNFVISANTAFLPKHVGRWKKMTPYIFVSAISGTAPTLDVAVEAQYDDKWIAIYNFPQITAVGNYRQPPLEIIERRVRFSFVVGGTDFPSFTLTFGAIYKS